MRFLLIDRITLWEPGVKGTAIKNVALSEDFFEDHFPLKPIMPGVLIIEGMAQLSGLLLEEGVRKQSGQNIKALLSIINKSKFLKPVRPGDCIEYKAEVLSFNDAGGSTSVKAMSNGEVIAESNLVFSFHHIENPHLESRRTEILRLWLEDLEKNAK
jgi:3-hydroxymyristoyl/3-hydroxydecanoyl-(acyl carrier protein) dehydratase